MKFKGLKGVIILFVLALLIGGYYYYLSNRPANKSEEQDIVPVSHVTEVLMRNLNNNYPATPKEVIKYFGEITQCFYNEEYTEEELNSLADKILVLYDDELVSYKTHEDYIIDLKNDIAIYKENGYKLSSYAPSASTDVEFFTEDGYEWARIWCIFTIKSGKYFSNINEVFILRKDDDSHWRIFGWDVVDE